MALYYTIQEAWRIARASETDEMKAAFTENVHHEAAHKLEALLGDRFESSLEQYNDGLISASELFTKLYIEAYRPIQPEEQETL